ncbi:hypothetical protein GFO94_16970 [Salmonella enterica]|nr:hypothetical protein [Salmonella enterica]
MAARTPQTIRHAQRTFCQIPVQTVLLAAVRMMARHPPRRIVRAFKPRPGVVIPFAARLPVHRHAVVVVVRKLALIPCRISATVSFTHELKDARFVYAATGWRRPDLLTGCL